MGKNDGIKITGEYLITLRTAFDFAKREVFARLGEINPPDVAIGIYNKVEPLLDETAEGLLNAIATDTAETFLDGIVSKEQNVISHETVLMFCQLCLENAEDILAKMKTTD